MKTENYFSHFIFLFGGLLMGLGLLVVYRSNNLYALAISASIIIYYIVWGIIHHAIDSRLTWSIALEYVLLGLLMFGFISFLMY